MLGTEHLGMGGHPTTQEDGRRGGDLTGGGGGEEGAVNPTLCREGTGKGGGSKGVWRSETATGKNMEGTTEALDIL